MSALCFLLCTFPGAATVAVLSTLVLAAIYLNLYKTYKIRRERGL
jgi:hypothetical protein